MDQKFRFRYVHGKWKPWSDILLKLKETFFFSTEELWDAVNRNSRQLCSDAGYLN